MHGKYISQMAIFKLILMDQVNMELSASPGPTNRITPTWNGSRYSDRNFLYNAVAQEQYSRLPLL